MKKMILTAVAALLLAVPVVQAQKVNKDAFLAKIAKSDSDIADAKKNGKAATWLNRGKVFYEAAAEPTKNIYLNSTEGMKAPMIQLAVGQPLSTGTEVINKTEYKTMVYPYFTAYLQDDALYGWIQTDWVDKDAVAKAFEAYDKAYQIDPKTAPKVKEGLVQLVNFCKQHALAHYSVAKNRVAADLYAQAYEMECHPALNQPEDQLLYNAGLLMSFDGAANPESFKKGEEYLSRVKEKGYKDEDGRIYYYLFHCYYGQRAEHPEKLMKAKDALLEGIKLYPRNEMILEGLMQLYTVEQNVGDPADLVALIEGAIAESPNSVNLWFGRGRIFYALKNLDESIVSFKKVTELDPNLFEGQFYLGLFYIFKGDEENAAFNDAQFSSTADMNAAQKKVEDIYRQAVAPLEKALELRPTDLDTASNLKAVCFRLRDDEGMEAKYNKYNEIYKQLNAAQ